MKDHTLNALGEALRSRRKALGLSQESVAERSGLHWTYIGGVERGERNLGFLNLLAIAKALESSASELIEGIR